MEASNVKELREALERSTRRLEAVLSAFECGEMSKYINADIQDNRAVLSGPPRNCDVGNAEEQHRRFVEFCHKADECSSCILSGLTESECALLWGELPFGTKNNEKQMQDCTNCGTNRDECERENATRYGVCGNWTKKEEQETTTPTIELKPCPFCGGTAKASGMYVGGESWGAVSCTLCPAKIEYSHNEWDKDCPSPEKIKAFLSAAWNRRVSTPSQREATMPRPKLKPCPFCGKEPKVIRLVGSYGYYPERYVVKCQTQDLNGKNTCPCYGSEYSKFLPGERATEEEAIEAWNTRTANLKK